MTINKAIRRLSDQIDLLTKDKDYPLESALKLGIEALKTVRRLQVMDAEYKDFKLPGETEEIGKDHA